MTEQAEISTPVETTAPDTSAITEPEITETPVAEPETADTTAETEAGTANAVEKMYAGKYKTVNDLEKGYIELQKFLSKPNEYEQKYNDLVKKQEEAEQKQAQDKLREANSQGFRTVEEQQAHETLQATELEWYANNLAQVLPENYDTARSYLGDYLRTGQQAYLNEAKKLFPLDFVEAVANSKAELKARLHQQIATQQQQKHDEFNKNLAKQIKTNFAEFLKDSTENSPKANTLKAMCDAGAINSLDDMQNFVNLYTSITDLAKKQAIDEYKAGLNIDATKDKAVIDTTAISTSTPPVQMPSYNEIVNMSQDEYNAAVEKYGLERLLQAK